MSEGITYQNKDTISKIFAEKFGSKSLEVYGIHIPKYLAYVTRVITKYFAEGKRDIKVRLIVIYTADVQPKKERETYSNICLTLNMETAYPSQLDADGIKKELTDKVGKGEKLTDEELMKFIILPLAYKTKEKKQEAIKECIELAKDVKD